MIVIYPWEKKEQYVTQHAQQQFIIYKIKESWEGDDIMHLQEKYAIFIKWAVQVKGWDQGHCFSYSK